MFVLACMGKRTTITAQWLSQGPPKRRASAIAAIKNSIRRREDASADSRWPRELGRSSKSDDRFEPTPNKNVPFKTASSRFIFGRSAAAACLLGGRRRINHVYRVANHTDNAIGRLASENLEKRRKDGLKVSTLAKSDLESIVGGRPHQGILLDVGPLPFPTVTNLGQVLESTGERPHFHFNSGTDSAEGHINNATVRSPLDCQQRPQAELGRQPLVLFLDGIKDEGNLGNIVRTAFYYGVDAIAISAHGSASIDSPIVAKAASGAIESMPFFKVIDPVVFLSHSKRHRWEVWAAVAPRMHRLSGFPKQRTPEALAQQRKDDVSMLEDTQWTATLESPLRSSPVILMLGSEGAGLQKFCLKQADRKVAIAGASNVAGRPQLGIDSINVASAAAVLIEAFLRVPTIAATDHQTRLGKREDNEQAERR